MPEQPNVVLIFADQWRGDCLSLSGHPVVHTPHLDMVGLGGARFDRAYSAVPSCIAARAALLTGLHQRSHGRVSYMDGIEWNYPTTLAGEFTNHGYQTQAVGKMHVYPTRSQIDFQNVILHDSYTMFLGKGGIDVGCEDDYLPWLRDKLGREDAAHWEHGVNCNCYTARPWDKPEEVHPTNFVTTEGINFLRRRDRRKPFFLMLSYYHPHPPLTPPDWAFQQYMDMEMPDVPVGDWWEEVMRFHSPHNQCAVGDRIPPHLLKRARAGYYGLITHIDAQIGRFMQALGSFGESGNTVVCFTTDHGENLGDHHLFRKGTPYEGSARVPMLLSGPGRLGIDRNSAHNQPIELRDVMPTLLDCAGLPIPDCVEGRSFLPIARGEDVEWRDCIQGEHGAGCALMWVTDGHEKYIWFSDTGMEQLFDIDNDPQELHNLAATSPKKIERWRKILIAELEGREEGFTDGERLITGRPTSHSLSFLREQPGNYWNR